MEHGFVLRLEKRDKVLFSYTTYCYTLNPQDSSYYKLVLHAIIENAPLKFLTVTDATLAVLLQCASQY